MLKRNKPKAACVQCGVRVDASSSIKYFARWRALFVLLVSVALSSPFAPADFPERQSFDLSDLETKLNQVIKQGDLEAALAVAQDIVARASATHGSRHLATAQWLAKEGEILAALGRYGDALTVYNNARQIREAELGSIDPSVADILLAIAGVLQADARSQEAAQMLRQAVVIREETLGTEHPDTAGARNQLGACLFSDEKYLEAGECFERCLVVWEKKLGPTHPQTALALTNLGAVYREQEKLETAKMLVRRAFAIRQESLGEDHEKTVDSIFDMGLLFFLEGSNDQSERLLAHVLEVRKSRFGSEDSQLPRIARVLAAVYRAQGKEQEALSLDRDFDVARSATSEQSDDPINSGAGD